MTIFLKNCAEFLYVLVISNKKNLSKRNALLNFAEIRTLNCNSTNFQKIRDIDVCHMPIWLDQRPQPPLSLALQISFERGQFSFYHLPWNCYISTSDVDLNFNLNPTALVLFLPSYFHFFCLFFYMVKCPKIYFQRN